MKKLIAISCAIMALFVSGCTSTAGAIDAATTRVKINQGKNKGFELAFPKELQATKLDVSIDPATGKISIKADQLKSSSTSVIESAGAAQAQALVSMAQMLSGIMPLILKAATGLEVPAEPEPEPANQTIPATTVP